MDLLRRVTGEIVLSLLQACLQVGCIPVLLSQTKSSRHPYEQEVSKEVNEGTKKVIALLNDIITVTIQQNKGKGGENAKNKQDFMFSLKVEPRLPSLIFAGHERCDYAAPFIDDSKSRCAEGSFSKLNEVVQEIHLAAKNLASSCEKLAQFVATDKPQVWTDTTSVDLKTKITAVKDAMRVL